MERKTEILSAFMLFSIDQCERTTRAKRRVAPYAVNPFHNLLIDNDFAQKNKTFTPARSWRQSHLP